MAHQYKITNRLALISRTPIEEFRCKTFWTKEPETLLWIDRFLPKSTFIDIGANIGIYSLYAASIHPKMNIFAIEPLKENFQSLKENISLNKFNQITPLNCAISDIEGNATLHVLSDESGASGSQINSPITEKGDFFLPKKEEIIPCTTVDRLCESYNIDCQYLKIDIDGQEWQVLNGAKNSLETSIKSVLVELNPRSISLKIVHEWMKEKGFSIDQALHSLPNHSNSRKNRNGPFNFIYSK